MNLNKLSFLKTKMYGLTITTMTLPAWLDMRIRIACSSSCISLRVSHNSIISRNRHKCIILIVYIISQCVHIINGNSLYNRLGN